MTLSRRIACVLCLAAALTACASDDGARGDQGGRPAGPPRLQRPLPNIFISPAGEPFRAEPGQAYPIAAWFARADRNGDGRLSPEEFRADGLAFFDRLDLNHDGRLDGLEVQTYEQNVAPEILPTIEGLHAMEGMDNGLTFGDANNSDNRPDSGRRRSLNARQPASATGVGVQGAAVYSVINTPEPVAAADEKFDGRITREEFADTLDRRFATLDKTGSGFLTLAALPKTPIQAEILKRAAEAKKRKERRRREDPPPAP